MIGWRTRVAVLWLVAASVMSASMLMAMFEPGVLSDVMAGEVEGMDTTSFGVQFLFAVNWLAFLSMAYLTLVLTDVVNRWANLAVAGVFVAWWAIDLVGHLGEAFTANTLLVILGLATLLTIVWHTWKWPTPVGVTESPREQVTPV